MAGDYYELLGVSRDATEDEIKRAYRRLARQHHPDANPDDPEAEARFKEITLAYEVLRDPERRRRYDMFGPDAIRGAGAPTGGFGDPGSIFAESFGGLFDAFFGSTTRSTRRSGPARGADAQVTLEVPFEVAVNGAEKEVRVEELVVCESCGGSGARAGTRPTRCPDCGGTGEVRRVRQSILGQVVTATPCLRCRGSGEVILDPCPHCHGEGRRSAERTFTVDIPPGVEDGTALRLAGRGPAGPRGGVPGDLYVHLRVLPDERFERIGDDLHSTVHIAMTQAALGADVKVQTLEGEETLAIPAGTQSGKIFRLRNRGVPHLGHRGRGDLIIEVVVDTPTHLDREQERLLRELAKVRGEEISPHPEGLRSRLRSAFG